MLTSLIFSIEGKVVYWNIVHFIVCTSHLTTYEQAMEYVDWFIAQSTDYEEDVFDLSSFIYRTLNGCSPREIKEYFKRMGYDPRILPIEIKHLSGMTEEELHAAYMFRKAKLN